MALQKTLSLLLLSLLTLLGLGLAQPSNNQVMYQRFLRQHVDSTGTGGTNWYCDKEMRRRGMTSGVCKPLNTFIHADILTIHGICNAPSTQCNNGNNNCHAGWVSVTDCTYIGGYPPFCSYQATASNRPVVIACEDMPMPVHFDR